MGNLWLRMKLWENLVQIIYLFRVISANSGKSNFDEEIYKLANQINENYFQVFKCVTYAADDVSNVVYLERIVPMFVLDLSGGGSTPSGGVLREALEQGCGGIIVQTKGENRMRMIQALRHAKTEVVGNRYNKERYLFLPVSGNDTNAEFLHDDSMYFFPNLLFVSSDPSSGRFFLNSHVIFDPEKTEPVEVLDSWTFWGGFQRGVDLYPDKVKNLKGKQLVFGVMQYIPYSVIIHDGNRTIYDGIDARMMIEFLKIVNGTFAGLDHPIELWGYKLPNGSATGIFGSVQRHVADMGYAAVYQWFCEDVDCTYPYIEAEVFCLVPKPKILNNWMTIVLPFTVSTWIGLFVAFLFSCSFLCAVSLATRHIRGAEVKGQLLSTALQSAFNVFRLQMQQIPAIAHKNHPVSAFIKISLLFHFTMSIFWQGGIASILTVPRYEKPIDTAADLLARWPKVKWGSNSNVWQLAIQSTIDPDLREIVNKYEILDNKILEELAKLGKFAFFVERLPNKHFGFTEHVNEETVPYMRLMKYYLYTANTVIILPRGSPFTEKLDHTIHWLFDTGIIQKIEIQVSLECINNHLQNMIRFSDEKEGGRAVLTIGHIQGPLYIYFGGIFISVAALLGEKLDYIHCYLLLERAFKSRLSRTKELSSF